MISRRHGLRSVSLLAAAALTPALPAAAFRIQEETSESPRVKAMLEACETRDAHARLADELIASFEGRGAGHEKAVETVRAMSCPLCGCRLAESLPEAKASPRF